LSGLTQIGAANPSLSAGRQKDGRIMPLYTTAEELYQVMDRLFSQLRQEKPGAVEAVAQSRLIIALRFTDVEASVLINGRKRPPETVFGPTSARPDLEVSLTTAVLHEILSGQLYLSKAMVTKQVSVKGASWKTLALADLFYHCQAIYPQVVASL
jgi:putative sterol carrier protein